MYTEEQYILEIGQALADDHAAVMVGAGFSKNAEKISTAGREFLNWNQLSDLFYEKLYGDSEYPGKNYCSSLRLAEEVEIMVGRPGLEKILKQAVPDEDFVPSRLYKNNGNFHGVMYLQPIMTHYWNVPPIRSQTVGTMSWYVRKI